MGQEAAAGAQAALELELVLRLRQARTTQLRLAQVVLGSATQLGIVAATAFFHRLLPLVAVVAVKAVPHQQPELMAVLVAAAGAITAACLNRGAVEIHLRLALLKVTTAVLLVALTLLMVVAVVEGLLLLAVMAGQLLQVMAALEQRLASPGFLRPMQVAEAARALLDIPEAAAQAVAVQAMELLEQRIRAVAVERV